MRFLFACICALLVSQATCMSNREFAELMLESADESEIDEFYPGDEDFDDPNEEAIMLPGGPDDEVDIEYLMIQTGLAKNMISNLKSLTKSGPVGRNIPWGFVARHVVRYAVRKAVRYAVRHAVRRASRSWSGSRQSRSEYRRSRTGGRRWWRRRSTSTEAEVEEVYPDDEDLDDTDSSSSDCIQHSFMVNLTSKKIRFPLNACDDVTYLKEVGVEMGLTLNGLEMFRKRISARNPPGLCDGIHGFKQHSNKVCLQLNDVNIPSKSFCLSLEGRLNILFKRFNVHVAIGCYQLEGLNDKELAHMMNDTTALASYLSNTDNPMIERSGDLFQAGIKTLPELMQYIDITEMRTPGNSSTKWRLKTDN